MIHYEFPYEIHERPTDVLILGAGSGNDVAAALRMGAGHVDAVEIDPAIVALGKAYHPERPYSSKKVKVHVDDARTFVRNSPQKYDLIIYGLLDSHTVLSQASSVRVDSFVYTVEGFREAKNLLKNDGMICVTFAFAEALPEVAKKFYLMMTAAFDGRPPVYISTTMSARNSIFVQGRRTTPQIPKKILEERGWQDATSLLDNASVQSEAPTDDWPFVYIPHRIYPFSYLPMAIVVICISLFASGSLLGIGRGIESRTVVFFLLGAGFMLIETKAITELGLSFGNTWQVIGIAIAGMLTMALLANMVVAYFGISRVTVTYILLGLSLLAGFYVAYNGGLPSTLTGKLVTAALVTCPAAFSGIIFSALLGRGGDISVIMAANLLGAMLGGLLEYNSMYFGFRFLYILALALYGLAFLTGYYVRSGCKTS